MASPSPRPGCLRVVVLSACRKGWNTYGRKSGAMPSPASVTVRLTRSPAPRSTTRRRLEIGVVARTLFDDNRRQVDGLAPVCKGA